MNRNLFHFASSTIALGTLLGILFVILSPRRGNTDAPDRVKRVSASPNTARRSHKPGIRQPKSSEWVTIASIRNDDKSAEQVQSVLKSANIPVFMEGSLGSYGVNVHPQHRRHALKILKADAIKHKYWLNT